MLRKIISYLIFLGFLSNIQLLFACDLDENEHKVSVASYLKTRLEELNLRRLFAVAGNYTAPFLDTILEDPKQNGIQITGAANELWAGYAADGYARVQGHRGISAVAVTYGVGAYSVLNAIAGSFVEQIPVVVINGAPTNKEFTNNRFTGLLYSHMIPDSLSNMDVFKNITVAAQRISNANEAPLQIDLALTQCITYHQPVYLEVLEDVWRAECIVPKKLSPLRSIRSIISRDNVESAVNKTIELILEYGNKDKAKPMFWVGAEIQRLGLQNSLKALLEKSGFMYTTSVLGKSVLSEDTKGFSRVGLPENASCVIGLGAWTTQKDIGFRTLINDRDKVVVAHGSAFVGGNFFANVPLQSFMEELARKLPQEITREEKVIEGEDKAVKKGLWAAPRFQVHSLMQPVESIERSAIINFDNFFKILNNDWIGKREDNIIVVDASFSLIAAQQGIYLRAANTFLAQGAWLSIGYASPAAIGVKCAIDDYNLSQKRTVVVAGDGAFQETCQAVSSYAQLGHNTVLFVLANGIYGIEQKLVNPSPFRRNPSVTGPRVAAPTTSSASPNDKVYPYNELQPWRYEKLAEVFGDNLKGHVVEEVTQLREVISTIQKDDKHSYIVHVKIPKLDIPSVLVAGLANPGEDETGNKEWPDGSVY